jgi:FKBP-type peptidyl-prolyl cis-trans isomerase 2
MHHAQLGDRVRIQYSRLRKHVDPSAKPRAPKELEFTVGSSDIIPSVSLGVVGMAPGDRKQLTLQPQETNGRVPARLARQKRGLQAPKHMEVWVGQSWTPMIAASDRPTQAAVVDVKAKRMHAAGSLPLVRRIIELEVMLLSLDSSSNANENLPQFDLGGEG